MKADLRAHKIMVSVVIGLVGNAILALSKLAAGILSGSMAVLADGIDSSTDVIISLVSLVAARIMAKPSDAVHPFGHGRAETIATNILAFVVFFAGAQLAVSTIGNLISGIQRELPASFALVVTAGSIVGKLLLAWQQFHTGKASDSAMLIANSKNMRNDVLISCTVFFGLTATYLFHLPVLDPIFALLVSGFIVKTAVGIFIETNTELMDGITDQSLYRELFDAVRAVEGARSPHRARIRSIANHLAIDLDIEVDGNLSVSEGHEIAIAVERMIKLRMKDVFDVMVHVEPIGSFEKEERFGLSESTLDASPTSSTGKPPDRS